MRKLGFNKWWEIYKPIKNHLDKNAIFDGHAFETYGEELDFVKSRPEQCIWTDIWSGEDEYILSGFRLVDRNVYFITEFPYSEDILIDFNDDPDYEEQPKPVSGLTEKFFGEPTAKIEKVDIKIPPSLQLDILLRKFMK